MKWALLLLLGCASERVVRVPMLVTPSCEVRNALEQCRDICIRDGKRPVQAVEDDTSINCNCVPFDASLQ